MIIYFLITRNYDFVGYYFVGHLKTKEDFRLHKHDQNYLNCFVLIDGYLLQTAASRRLDRYNSYINITTASQSRVMY